MRLSIAQVNKSQHPLISFRYISEARSFLLEKIETYQLCHRRVGLQTANCSENNLCGACKGTTKSIAYNVKMKRALASFVDNTHSYIIKQPGRTIDEYGVIIVEAGRYLGYAYIPNDLSGSSIEELKPFVNRHPDNRDIQKILAMHMRSTAAYEINNAANRMNNKMLNRI